jgi:hypothetical protein
LREDERWQKEAIKKKNEEEYWERVREKVLIKKKQLINISIIYCKNMLFVII